MKTEPRIVLSSWETRDFNVLNLANESEVDKLMCSIGDELTERVQYYLDHKAAFIKVTYRSRGADTNQGFFRVVAGDIVP